MGKDNVDRLAAQLGRSLCACPCGHCDLLTKDLGLCRTLIRLLAHGQPVSPEALADASGDSSGMSWRQSRPARMWNWMARAES